LSDEFIAGILSDQKWFMWVRIDLFRTLWRKQKRFQRRLES